MTKKTEHIFACKKKHRNIDTAYIDFFFAFHWGFSRMINKIESHVYDLRRKKIALARKGTKSK